MTPDINTPSGAVFNYNKTRRRRLWRVWDAAKKRLLFICLNPSKAGAIGNDQSVRKMIGFSERLGAGGFDVVNLFDLISTDPKNLYYVPERVLVSLANTGFIHHAAQQADMVICAWSKHGRLYNRDVSVLSMLRSNNIKTFCLRQNADGTPAHPLMLPYTCKPVLYTGGELTWRLPSRV